MDESVEKALVSAIVSAPDQQLMGARDVLFSTDQVVRLLKDIPELSLRCGELGIVISVWCSPFTVYEVEFYQPDEDYHTRVLVFAGHLRAEPALHA